MTLDALNCFEPQLETVCRAVGTLLSQKYGVRVRRNTMTARFLEDGSTEIRPGRGRNRRRLQDGSRVQTGDDCVKTTVGSRTME